ncbi:MAG: TetR/AcrR family transcriptional regulator [Ignavibacteriaceae bacterium]|nr:TetR/AcrR family transcriptional regulator [Ignavibacteriaceae bacterium]
MSEKPVLYENDARQRLLKAALEEFILSGYKGASTRAITERAGVNSITLFRQFGNKQGLLKEAVSNALEQMRMLNNVDDYLQFPLREGLTKLICDLTEQLENKCELFTFGIKVSFSYPDVAEVPKKLMWEIKSTLIDYFEKLAAQNRFQQVDFPVIAHLVISSHYVAARIRLRFPKDITKHLKDEGILQVLVDMIVSTYGTEPC